MNQLCEQHLGGHATGPSNAEEQPRSNPKDTLKLLNSVS